MTGFGKSAFDNALGGDGFCYDLAKFTCGTFVSESELRDGTGSIGNATDFIALSDSLNHGPEREAAIQARPGSCPPCQRRSLFARTAPPFRGLCPARGRADREPHPPIDPLGAQGSGVLCPQEPAFQSIADDYDRAVASRNFPPEAEARTRAVFDKVKWGSTDCRSRERGSGWFIRNAMYDRMDNEIQACNGAMIGGLSEFQLAYTIGHELGHVFDPCSIGHEYSTPAGPRQVVGYQYPADLAAVLAQYPFPRLLTCLREEKSVHARIFPRKRPERKYEHGDSAACGTAKEANQFGDAVADAQGTDFLADYVDAYLPQLTRKQVRLGYANTWRGSCDLLTDGRLEGFLTRPTDVHPELELRINRVIAASPQVRRQMGCTREFNEAPFCTIALDSVGVTEKDSKGSPSANQPEH